MIIRPMEPADLDFAASCTAAEGWATETRVELEGLFAHDPRGCLLAEVEGRRAGICVATGYDAFAFVGELIVAKELRGRGVGRALLEHAIAYLEGRGLRSVCLDGVPAAVPLYERLGFRRVCRSLRFSGRVRGGLRPQVRRLRAEDLPAVQALDRQAFGADRAFFLRRRLEVYPELGWALEAGDGIAGFILGRRGRGVVAAGPWVVRPEVARPADLLESLTAAAGEIDLSVGVLESNAAAVATLRALGLAERVEPPWRMVRGPAVAPAGQALAYAIGSAAKG